jgi:hypothetical protein
METLTVSNFSGGITDNYLSAPPNTCKEMHNFYITEDQKPSSREGWLVYPTKVPVDFQDTRVSGAYIGALP